MRYLFIRHSLRIQLLISDLLLNVSRLAELYELLHPRWLCENFPPRISHCFDFSRLHHNFQFLLRLHTSQSDCVNLYGFVYMQMPICIDWNIDQMHTSNLSMADNSIGACSKLQYHNRICIKFHPFTHLWRCSVGSITAVSCFTNPQQRMQHLLHRSVTMSGRQ